MKIKKWIKVRKKWAINPKTRVKRSKKVYQRANNKKTAKKYIKEL